MEIFEPLWDAHWIFRINPFLILYFITGPSIIYYMKPQMSLLKRNILMLTAVIISLMLIVLGMIYWNNLSWYKYYECEKKFYISGFEFNELCLPPGGIPLKYIEKSKAAESKIEKPQVPDNISIIKIISGTILLLGLIIFLISLHPFMSVPLFIWFLWHRKTITAMGNQFKGKPFLFFMMFGWLWSSLIPVIFIFSMITIARLL